MAPGVKATSTAPAAATVGVIGAIVVLLLLLQNGDNPTFLATAAATTNSKVREQGLEIVLELELTTN